MTGEDLETFTKEDIDRAIAYLFPSGLFEKQAGPIMKHPEQICPKQRAIQWGEDGRPFNFLFYTVDQSYYSLMHEVCGKVLQLETHRSPLSEKTESKDLIGSRWLIKEELEEMLAGKLSDQDYVHFIRLLEKLLTLPYGPAEEEFMQRFCKSLTVQSTKQVIEPYSVMSEARPSAPEKGGGRAPQGGSGKIRVNGVDICFPFLSHRTENS